MAAGQPAVEGMYHANWALGVKGAIGNVAKERFPALARFWPFRSGVSLEAFRVGGDHMVLIMRDAHMNSGGALGEFPYADHPPLPVTTVNVLEWHRYLVQRFNVADDDFVMVLPIKTGRGTAPDDFALYNAEERAVWSMQLDLGMERNHRALAALHPAPSDPGRATNVTYNFYGANARVNNNSVDNSVNVGGDLVVFEQIQRAIEACDAPEADKKAVADAVDQMRQAHGTSTFIDKYQFFMSTLSDHLQIAQALTPWVGLLARLLTG